MIDYRNIIKNRELRLKLITLLRFIPDELYLQLVFFIKNGKFLNLKNPQTFCEKLNWLKLHGYKPEYSDYVDKIKARDIVKEKLCEDISIPLLGKWKHYKDIDFDSLPNQFVLKCNHDSGSVKIIRDKKAINHKELEEFFEGRLKIDNYILGRDYYRNITPYIIAEKYMAEADSDDIADYKFFCFDGKPVIMFVATERAKDCKFDFYDMDFNHLDIVNIHPNSEKTIEKPSQFERMKEYAAKLSQGLKFVRIDLYEINRKVYFGEYTFFHGGGFWSMHSDGWEEKLGSWINLDK